MSSKNMNILFCGTGGQGVLTAAEICGITAMLAGYHVKKSEIHGMAQRGGSVESHLRFGHQVFSPLIPKGGADILVSFHADEESRMRCFLKKDGINLINVLDKIKEKNISLQFANTYFLGALARYLDIPKEHWLKAIEQKFFNKKLQENIDVFLEGLER